MNEDWRMAFIFDARDGAFDAMEEALKSTAAQIAQVAGDAHVRLGVADRHPDLMGNDDTEQDISGARTVDGAVEISVAAVRKSELSGLAGALSNILGTVAETGSLEVMAGPFYTMVPVRDGETFLSLAFRRDPMITSTQFQRWWYAQHAPLAIPVLGPGLLAYDQVHVDASETQKLAFSAKIESADYDAYDNLTWSDRYAYLESISDLDGLARLYEDEVGHIDNSSRRHALMRKLSG